MDDEMGWEAQQDNEERLAAEVAKDPQYLDKLKKREGDELDRRIARMEHHLKLMKEDSWFGRHQ